MSFGSPYLLLGLVVLPLLVLAYVLLERRRSRRVSRWATPALVPNLVPRSPRIRRHIPTALFLIGLALLLVGFARPQATVTVAREGATVVLATDVSGSMDAKDVKPTRLRAARAATLAFLDELPAKYRVALVTFSDHAAVAVVPTYDRDRVRHALPVKAQLEGTALGDAMTTAVTVAVKAVGRNRPGVERPPAAVLLLSDGSQTSGRVQPQDAAARARKAGVPISTVVLGTPDGVVQQKLPGTPYVETRQVPPNPALLRAVAESTGGKFYQAATGDQLKQVYEDLGSRAAHTHRKRELTAGATGLALLFILAGVLASGLWFRRLV
jgi:Ca-activated chloride channel family protein